MNHSMSFLTTVFQMDPCLLRSSGVSRIYELVTNVLPQKSQWLVELLPTPARQTGDWPAHMRPTTKVSSSCHKLSQATKLCRVYCALSKYWVVFDFRQPCQALSRHWQAPDISFSSPFVHTPWANMSTSCLCLMWCCTILSSWITDILTHNSCKWDPCCVQCPALLKLLQAPAAKHLNARCGKLAWQGPQHSERLQLQFYSALTNVLQNWPGPVIYETNSH